MTQWGLDTIFNPGKRHMDEEKRRLQSTREEIGDSSGGRRIDLESGKVTIRRGKPRAEGEDEDADDADGDGAEDADEDAAEDADEAAEGEAADDEADDARDADPGD